METGTNRTNRIRFLTLGLALLAASLLVLFVAGKPAQAAFPGQNGKIAFTNDGDGDPDIYSMNPGGTGVKKLTNNSVPDGDPASSPDGTKIAFTRHLGSYPNINPEIYVMNADGTNQRRLTSNAARDENPAFSPDGTKIAFESDRAGDTEVYVMNANGTGVKNLTNNLADDSEPSFSPNGTKISFTSDRAGGPGIYVMNTDGTNQRRLTNNPSTEAESAFSPDGTKIAFMSYRAGDPEIYVMNVDGTNQRRLTNNPARDWMPDWQVKPDTAKPTISGMIPRHRSITRDTTPNIAATVRDNTTNLRKSNVKLYVAGKRVTDFRYSVSTDKLTYTSPRLTKGRKVVKVVARDSAGNVGVRSWYFTIR